MFYYSGIHNTFSEVKCWRSKGLSSTMGFGEPSIALAVNTELYFYLSCFAGIFLKSSP